MKCTNLESFVEIVYSNVYLCTNSIIASTTNSFRNLCLAALARYVADVPDPDLTEEEEES